MSEPDFKSFAAKVMRACHGGEVMHVDADEIHEWAIKFGLIEEVTVTEPCGEQCLCAEYFGEFPTKCYRETPATKAVPS